jgi:hypothetical protein
MFVQDYQGFANAGMIQGQGIANIGAQIGQLGREYGDFKKRQKEDKDKLKAGAVQIEAAAKLFPSYGPVLEDIGMQLKDENMPLSERAAIASQIGDMINMTVGESRWQAEMGLRQQDMKMREQEAGQAASINKLRLTEAEMELNRKREEDALAESVGPALLSSRIEALNQLPEKQRMFSPDYLASTKALPARAQFELAKLIEASLPEKAKRKLQTIPATIDGQPGELPVLIDEYGNMDQVEMGDGVLPPKGALGGGKGMQAPPSDISTNEGAVLPANESTLVGQGVDKNGKPIEIWNYNGRNYTAPMQAGPAEQQSGISVGRKIPVPGQLTEKDKIELEAKQKEANQASSTSVEKSKQMLSVIDSLYSQRTDESGKTFTSEHPGFENLFGTNIGIPTWWGGSSGADAKVLFEQLKAKGFLEAVKDMKGMGALSDKEGARLDVAFLGLDSSMSEKAAKARLKEVREIVSAGIDRAETGNLVNPDGTPLTPEQKAQINRQRETEKLRTKLGK